MRYMAATTSIPPAIAVWPSVSPPSATAKTAANIGSVVRITAACVAESRVWAQVWMV